MNAKKKDSTENNPFESLLEDVPKVESFDISDKTQKRKESRASDRQRMTGAAALFDLQEKLITKAVFRNLSPGGVGFEIFPVNLSSGTQVFALFSHAPNLGMVACTVQWIASIEGHPKQHKMIGLKFDQLSTLKQEKLNTFLDALKNSVGYDPFSR